jgi:hypothetical protein
MTAAARPLTLRLYLTGRTIGAERARAAIADLTCRLVARRGTQAIMTEIIDVLEHPEAAMRDCVFATPTLIRTGPGPALRLFGDLSSASQIMDSLGIECGGDPDIAESGVADPAARGEDIAPCPRGSIPSRMSSSPAAVRE